MAAAALRRLATKFRNPRAAAHRFPKDELENALLLKNNIESAKAADLNSSADLLAKHCWEAEQTISHFHKRHEQVVERARKTTVRVVCAAVVVGSLDRLTTWYWFPEDEC
ncbi:uncharacterized protein [Triticum aestivum]|uniref:uncharacterized protein n=1 Tax=Triticum aestivum TaxID=4565 RepID=UPI001D03447D|nr:uncharacterized protein LOC123135060 [Triticum aestivum]XP_044410120.1 uncharacterized protein LOC123135062 [Triticum aestivum]